MHRTLDAPRSRSREAAARLAQIVPGGAHTYAKGEDQFPQALAPVIARGLGSHVWDVDGNEYVEYGSGLRAVSLGHAHPDVLAAVRHELERGSNFSRPSQVELAAAERFLTMVPTGEMVKFAKNGSDATTAAVRLARAVTGRDLVAVCRDQPFFSTDDWFIGTTPMIAGIPKVVRDLTLTFPYADLPATEAMLREHEGQVACLILEPAGVMEPPPGYLNALLALTHRYGALLILDESITGFRWSSAGGQGIYCVVPDLSVFAKAIGNGFAVAALTGRREIMERGGLGHEYERAFLLSSTHGAETHSLAAAVAVMDVYDRDGTVERLHELGAKLAVGVRGIATEAGIEEHLLVRGRDSNLVFATLDDTGQPSQDYRTLFLRQLILGGIIAPSFVVSSALTDSDIARTLDVVAGASLIYRKALESGDPSPWMGGRPVKPVFRLFD